MRNRESAQLLASIIIHNRQQTVTRGNLLKRKYREHPLSVQSHGLRSDAAA